MPNQVLGVRIRWDNDQDQRVRSGNYCCLSIWVASIDETKNTAIERLPWFILKPLVQITSLFMQVKKGARLREVGVQAPVFEKSATEIKLKQKLQQCKTTIQIATFNIRTLNRISPLPELIASAIDHNIDIICIQEHRCLHSEEIEYHDTAYAWKNSVNSVILGVGMLIGPRALKSLNSTEKIQPSMMLTTFNGNPSATIICYSPINVSEETDLLSSLVRSIAFYPPLFVASRNTTFSSSVETWIPKLVKT